MKTLVHQYDNLERLEQFISSTEAQSFYQESSDVLVQLYSDEATSPDAIINTVKSQLPKSTILGATSAGEIQSGIRRSGSTTIIFNFFEHAKISKLLICLNTHDLAEIGDKLPSILQNDTRLLLAYSTPFNVSPDAVLHQLSEKYSGLIAGGVVGNDGSSAVGKVFDDKQQLDRGIALVTLNSERLSVSHYAHMLWQPIGKKMTITKASGKRLYRIDDVPALKVYQHYLGFSDKESFTRDALRFPLLISRDQQVIARAPFFHHKDGSLEFAADIYEGDQVQIAYGDVNLIHSHNQSPVEHFKDKYMESFWVFSCISRSLYLNSEVDNETRDLEQLAPTNGFYTYGEFCSNAVNREVLNMTLTVIGLSENEKAVHESNTTPIYNHTHKQEQTGDDIASRLTHLIKVTTRELESTAEEMAKANQLKSRFLANMSHEIRTPLTSIIGYTDHALAVGASKQDRIDSLNTIRRNGQHLLGIISDILDFSKIEAGKLEVEILPVLIFAIVDDVKVALQSEVNRKGLYFNVQYEYPIPPAIMTDPTRLSQILLNLGSNAIKFTEKGGVSLNISYLQSVNKMKFTVTDSGIGMDLQETHSLFDPFIQHDLSITREFGGTGLGLSISQHLAQALGGVICVDSQLNKGSEFSVTVDCGPNLPEFVYEHPDIGAETVQLPDTNTFRGTVLVAEDHPDNQELIRILLEKLDVDVEQVPNGKEAAERAFNESFDLILMDIQMPVMDGVEATSLIRQSGVDVPIVALTANVMKHDIDSYFDAGFTDYLEKPIRKTKFNEILTQYLEKSEQVHRQVHEIERKVLQNPKLLQVSKEFAQRFKEYKLQSQRAFDIADFEQLQFIAHSIKGSASSFGFPELSAIAENVEFALIHEQDIDEPYHRFIQFFEDNIEN